MLFNNKINKFLINKKIQINNLNIYKSIHKIKNNH